MPWTRREYAAWVACETDITGLLDLLARAFDTYGKVLRDPKDVSEETIQKLLTSDDVDPFRLPELAIVRWAATNGHLKALNNQILARVSELFPESEIIYGEERGDLDRCGA